MDIIPEVLWYRYHIRSTIEQNQRGLLKQYHAITNIKKMRSHTVPLYLPLSTAKSFYLSISLYRLYITFLFVKRSNCSWPSSATINRTPGRVNKYLNISMNYFSFSVKKPKSLRYLLIVNIRG